MKPSVLTAGTFDGVHRGHREVLRYVREVGEREGLEPLAVTFDRHPLQTIDPKRAPAMLTGSARRDELIRAEGVTPVELPFDDQLRSLTAEEWIAEMAARFGARIIVMGYDHTFGKDGLSMSLEDYRRLAASHGISILQAPIVEGVSSSAVRKAIAAGDVETAARLLGRPHAMAGDVVHGRGLGRTLGFPTANIRTIPGVATPAGGVYAAEARLEDGSRRRAVVNIGSRPTIDGPNAPTSIEAHLLDFDDDLYGARIELAFLRRLRNEMKFDNVDLLADQIEKDCADARNFPAPSPEGK